MSPRRSFQHGFALVAEIFVLVLVAALAAAGLSLAVSQQAGVTQEARATEAELAARAGIEWAAYQTLNNDCGAFAVGARTAPVSAVTPLAGSLADFQVVVTASAVTAASAVDCAASGVPAASAVGWAYAVSSVATAVTAGSGVTAATNTQAGRADYSERTLQVRMDRN